jgi:hypothetical protein
MKVYDDDKVIDITDYSKRKPADLIENVKMIHSKQQIIKQNHQNVFNNLIMQVVLVNQVITYIVLYYLAIR